MNLKKRTADEVNYSVDVLKDYTGGYEFLPWLIWMRPLYLLGLAGNLAVGITLFISADKAEWTTWAGGLFFGLCVPALILYMLRRDYKMSKIGQSS